MVLRSDEAANQAAIQRDQQFRSNVGKGVGAAASLAAGAGAGSLTSKVMPFLNQYVPAGLAVKGINKVSPKLGAFLQKGQEMGLDVEEGLNFIKGKLGGENKEPAKQDRNIIEQYSPNLYQYLQDLISKGSSPLDAGAKARKFLDKTQQDIISQIEKDHKTDWSSIVQTVFGGPGMAPQQSQGQPQQPPQPPGQGGQQGGGKQAFMDFLGKVSQKYGL